jgi:hypothetical protein
VIIKAKVELYDGDDLVADSVQDVEISNSWYTGQNYFDEHIKDELFTGYCDRVVLKWQGKEYEFKRKKNDD